ncbi:unnamed protein product [marine sediment metagenome]|uniref:Uncharacterized protein n=1 Tax=marine sediment metagenome TaxID=412755 RepID=X1M0F8_9ZZZZ
MLAADDDLLDYITSKTPGSGLGIETREDICNFVISAPGENSGSAISSFLIFNPKL